MIENSVKPFWKKPLKFLAYPFLSIRSILLIAVLALFSTLFSRPGIVTSMLSLLPWAIMLKYAYEALRSTMEGHSTAPPLSSIALGSHISIVSKQIVLTIALLLINGLIVPALGHVAWFLYGLCVLLCLPSMIMILTVNDNLARALNPVHFIGMARRIGKGYIYLFFFLVILIAAPSALGNSIIHFLPESVQVFIWMAARNYYTLVSYHLIGYVMIQYHHRLNHDVNNVTALSFPEKPPAPLKPSKDDPPPPSPYEHDTNLLKKVRSLIQRRELDSAIAIIQHLTRLDINDLTLSECYIDLLKMRNRQQELLEYTPRHLELLVASEEKTKALALCLQYIKANTQLRASPATLMKIGGWFNEKGEAELAVHTLNTLIKTYPDDLLAPEVCLQTAQIQHDKLGKTETARKMLNYLISKYPDHDVARIAQNYLNIL